MAPDRGSQPATDPAPEPPPQPDLDECCGSGCNPCIFDVYAAALDRYRAELQAWRERRSEADRNDE